MLISATSKKLLNVFFLNPGQKFHINELIRQTGQYPNSTYKALITLEKQNILKSTRSGRLRLFSLNESFEYLPEIKRIVGVKQKSIKASKSRGWVKILNRQSSFSFTEAVCISNVKNLKNVYGFSIPTFWHNSVTLSVYYLKNDLELLGKTVSKLIESDPKFAENDIALCRTTCDNLTKFSQKILVTNLPQQSDQELHKLLRDFYLLYLKVFPFVTIPHGIERYFESKIKNEINDEETFKILLSPVSTEDEERDSAFRVAAYAKENGCDKKFRHLLIMHWEKFCWLPLWSIHADLLEVGYFENEIKNILENVKNPQGELNRLQNEDREARKKLKKTLSQIKASPSLKQEVSLLQEYILLRIYRKNAICKAHFHLLPLLYEIASRSNLTPEEIKLLSLQEILDGLAQKVSHKKLKQLATNRSEGWAILMRYGKIRTITGVKEIIETMERFQIIAPTSAMQRSVKGSVASRGKATGRVKVVTKLSELSKVEEGNVLVTKMTTPDYVVAMHKVAAIVTDEGGVTCHAAIVSREFNIPCITGTRNATQVLSDNDLVEVDAINGIVRIVEAVEIPEDIRVIPGTTIYKGKVKGVARIILDASDFIKIQHGDILIAPQTTPEYLSSLYRVKGFVVDEESLTSHANLYGKALKIPSIMGTNFARNAIKDGNKVELDATNGVLKRL